MRKVLILILIIAAIFFILLLAYTANEGPQNKKDVDSQENKPVKSQFTTSKVLTPKIASKKEATKIYFPSGSVLRAEVSDGHLEPKEALKILMRGPKQKGNESFIPAKTRIVSFKVASNRATVNFSKEILNPTSVSAEAEELTIYSITNTLTEFSDIKEVVIQVEGKSEGEIGGYLVEDFWGHVGLYDQPFKRNQGLIR